jgi:hypothetical protein
MKRAGPMESREERAKSEREFNAWLDSIHVVDKDGNVIPRKLVPDTTPDPENDRGEEE